MRSQQLLLATTELLSGSPESQRLPETIMSILILSLLHHCVHSAKFKLLLNTYQPLC